MVIPVANNRNLTPDQRAYLIARGCIIKHGIVLAPFECPQLIKPSEDEIANGRTETTCRIQDHKPLICRDFDGRPISHGRKYYVPDCCAMTKRRRDG